ncbi:MAG: GLUG motif-containing protein [Sedimentisphaerales bacterium]
MRGKANHLIWLLCVLFLTRPVRAQYGGGSGTAEDPYLIYTAEQMNTIGTEPNDWDKHFKLVADIDLKDFGGSSFNLIGSGSYPFKGVFDGNGHAISNLIYAVTGNEEPADDRIMPFGLFRLIDDPNAVIKDLSMVNPDIRPASTCQKWLWYVGALAGSLGSGSISNCSIEGGQVQAERMVGGLVGSNRGTISDCYTTCTVGPAEQRSLLPIDERMDKRESFGGLAGINYGEISSCYAIGEISGEGKIGGLVGEAYFGMISNSWSGSDVSGDVEIGGLVGKNIRTSKFSHCYATGHVSGRRCIGGLVGLCKPEASIDNCYATGSVSAEEWGGGLVGVHEGTLSECYATAFVFINAGDAGGLVGRNGGTIRMSCAQGHVSGSNFVGGLVGLNLKYDFLNYDPVVTDSYAGGSVHGENSVGGLIGQNQGGTVSRCYSTAKVTGATEGSWTGGLVCANIGGVPVENSFWDTEASGVTRSDGGEGKTTSEMQNMWMYLSAGWDFAEAQFDGTDDAWRMCCGRPIYPKLAWEQMLVGDFVDPEGVDLADIAFLAEHWLQTVAFPCDAPDLTVDGQVDIEDLELMMQYWGHGMREVIFEAALDETPGFAAQGQWQFGAPAGLGGAEYGHSDPNAGYTGDNVYGVNLQGDYPTAADGPHYLTAGPLDCRLYHDVKLQFARWLNTDEADYIRATIEFSTDGTRWAPVWGHEDTEAGLTDDAWQVVVYSLGAMADHRENLYIRWGYEVKDNESWPMSGWNIDDIKLLGVR